jgi:CHAP domain
MYYSTTHCNGLENSREKQPMKNLLFKITSFISILTLAIAAHAAASDPTTPVLSNPLNGQIVNQDNIAFNWSASNATSYRIVISQLGDFSGFADNGTNATCDSTCITSTTLFPSYTQSHFNTSGITYYWMVKAINSSATQPSPWSAVSGFYVAAATTPDPTTLAPTTPVLNGATNVQTINQDNVVLNWSSTNATGYRVLISRLSDFSGFFDNGVNSTCTGTCVTVATEFPTYTHSHFSVAGQSYYWKVRANNANTSQTSSWSSVGLFTTVGVQSTVSIPSLQTFKDQLVSTFIDFDSAYGAQSVDLMRYYAKNFLGLPNTYDHLPRGNASSIFSNTTSNKFQKIVNSQINFPLPGDIVFWNDGKYGHVAIFLHGDVNSFVSLDQNWGTKLSPSLAIKEVIHSYKNVVGWLRYNN